MGGTLTSEVFTKNVILLKKSTSVLPSFSRYLAQGMFFLVLAQPKRLHHIASFLQGIDVARIFLDGCIGPGGPLYGVPGAAWCLEGLHWLLLGGPRSV